MGTFDGLRESLARVGAPVAEHLQPGMPADEVNALLRPLGLTPSRELEEWFAWQNGVPASEASDSSQRGIGPSVELTPLVELVGWCQELRSIYADAANEFGEESFWSDEWFPFVRSGGGIDVVCDLGEGPESPVLFVDPQDPFDEPPRVGSIALLASWWADALQDGTYRLDSNSKAWTVDYSVLEANHPDRATLDVF